MIYIVLKLGLLRLYFTNNTYLVHIIVQVAITEVSKFSDHRMHKLFFVDCTKIYSLYGICTRGREKN